MPIDNPLNALSAGLNSELFEDYHQAYRRYTHTKRDAETAMRSEDRPLAQEALAKNARAEEEMFLALGALLTDLEDRLDLPAWFQTQAIDTIKAEAARLNLDLGRNH